MDRLARRFFSLAPAHVLSFSQAATTPCAGAVGVTRAGLEEIEGQVSGLQRRIE
jgi:hypothetical protein